MAPRRRTHGSRAAITRTAPAIAPPAAPEGAAAPPLAGAGAGGVAPCAGSPEWGGFLDRLKTAIDAHAIVGATDAAGRITYANDRFCEVSGYPREQLLGQNHRLLKSGVHPPEFFATMWRTITEGRIWHGAICNRARDGHLYWVETTIVPFRDGAGKPVQYLSLRTEITRLKEVEASLARLTGELEKRVAERTAALAEANAALQREMEQRRAAAEKVAQSESLYRLLFQSVTDYFYTVEVRNGRAVATHHTQGCGMVTGYSPEDFDRDPLLWIKMVVPEDRPAVEAQAAAALEGRTPPPLEHRIVRKDGEPCWIRNTVVVRRDAAGRVVFYDGIISDITASRLAQEEVRRLNQELEHRVMERTAQLKAASDQFRLLFEHAPVGISWVEWGNPDIYHLNERFCQIIGLTAKEAERLDNIMLATHPDDRAEQQRLMEELWSGKRDRFSLEKRYVHKDGRVIWANLTVAALRNERGRLTQQFAMIEDVTERREAEERLRRSEQRFRRFVENANEILYSLTTDGHFLYVSPIWTSKLGHAVEAVVGQPVSRFIHPDDQQGFWDFLRHVLQHGRSSFSVEYRMQHKDGRYRWHASSGAVYFDELGEKLYMGVARDVTERKASQEELRAALARREELARIIHRSPSVVVLWRATEGWPVEFVSQNVAQFGYSAEEFLAGRASFIGLVHPDDRARVAEEVRQHGEAGRREYSQEYRIVSRDGATHWIDDRTVVRIDADGRVTHHEGILTDITLRKEIEQREAEARERDVRTAIEVQRHLLPNAVPAVAALDVASLYIPSRHIGGDYYDFFEVAPRQWAFVVADVSGKGASAALVMAACRTALRIEAPRQHSAAGLLRSVNRIIHPDMPEGMFISIIYGILDLDTRVFTFSRAGHETPIVLRAADGRVELPDPAGMALGLDAGAIFDEVLEEQAVTLGRDDLIVLYTDGITEVLDESEEEFGRGRLVEILTAQRAQPAAVLTHAVDEKLRAFAGVRVSGDDRTLLLVRLK